MQPRPIRSQLYLPILRFGITDEDWGFVVLASIAGYAVPFASGLEIYHLPMELAPTIYCDDLITESRCSSLARLLAARKPVGTAIQFRLSTGLDPGLALGMHGQARDLAEIHPLASILHDRGLESYAAMAASGAFRRSVLTCWVRVPSAGRGRADDLFLPTLKRELKNRGFVALPQALVTSWKASSAQQVVRRSIEEEAAAFAEAEKTFRLIERESALRFARFSREELWEAVFLGHRQNATSVPQCRMMVLTFAPIFAERALSPPDRT